MVNLERGEEVRSEEGVLGGRGVVGGGDRERGWLVGWREYGGRQVGALRARREL
jgi:hypothetical protein